MSGIEPKLLEEVANIFVLLCFIESGDPTVYRFFLDDKYREFLDWARHA